MKKQRKLGEIKIGEGVWTHTADVFLSKKYLRTSHSARVSSEFSYKDKEGYAIYITRLDEQNYHIDLEESQITAGEPIPLLLEDSSREEKPGDIIFYRKDGKDLQIKRCLTFDILKWKN